MNDKLMQAAGGGADGIASRVSDKFHNHIALNISSSQSGSSIQPLKQLRPRFLLIPLGQRHELTTSFFRL